MEAVPVTAREAWEFGRDVFRSIPGDPAGESEDLAAEHAHCDRAEERARVARSRRRNCLPEVPARMPQRNGRGSR
jgi:hypothetical protein